VEYILQRQYCASRILLTWETTTQERSYFNYSAADGGTLDVYDKRTDDLFISTIHHWDNSVPITRKFSVRARGVEDGDLTYDTS
jgi:hypothetical protein